MTGFYLFSRPPLSPLFFPLYIYIYIYKERRGERGGLVKRLSATTRVVRGPSGIGGQWLGVINYETRKTSTYVSGCGAYTPFGVGCNEKRVEARFFRKLRGSLIENPIRMKHPKERGLLRCPFPSLSLFLNKKGKESGEGEKQDIFFAPHGVNGVKKKTLAHPPRRSWGAASLGGVRGFASLAFCLYHTEVRKSNDSSKFADRVVRGSLEEMLLFDNNGKCINAMKLVSNKMILKNAYIKIKSDLASFPSSRLPSFIRRVSKVAGVDKAIFDVISEE